MKRLVVVSPHLDDAVFSVGALMHSLSRSGVRISVVTVLAGATDVEEPAGSWDRDCGFRTYGEASRRRRVEDARACRLLGAEPVWLPFGDEQYGRGADDRAVVDAAADAVAGADAVLLPGYPLSQPDHAWVTTTLLAAGVVPVERVGLYVEQPYAAGLDEPSVPAALAALESLAWVVEPVTALGRIAKVRAVSAYRSQRSALGRHWHRRQTIDEVRRGGEAVAWPPASGRGR